MIASGCTTVNQSYFNVLSIDYLMFLTFVDGQFPLL